MKTLVSRVALATVLLSSSLLAVAADGIPRSAPPEGAKVFIESPKDGATVDKTFTVKFGMEGLKLAPATDQTPGTGHHHLLVDQKELPDASVPIPATDTVIHYGKAQTETQLTLTPGKHTLQLVAGDKLHMQFNPTVASKRITVNVK
ncbi:DUF4399 domain-containing protein [Pseudomonas gingeri NCPPB 3146 = LMG 5327]|uniref:DUF4399 domain-containing protein n=2 Tax=Pseudomonas gingeri TaxID=117681 RepID=A0A7Y7XYP3_9PSED|nr:MULTISPECIES: DUF4399 domain-containing protein [Pseudomonas]NVZ28761.1 DUF4399 domain-containing protein [Pseudomonas gingeri]NVZ63412.1 DUF4399 domain-containing protein [Pseudomonas gingeri]NVZ79046.1 DUF4399 domain-containing protein [Pseudomonas gingeri]NWC14480.1 DUF4399 domain-containing protein [Pseudomonas gingeri]NWE47233.1 DUF4399 domain-containing protein [Pseudomonas gingeri]